MAAMVSVLFFLILFLFALLFCVLGSFRFLVVFGPIMMGLVSLGCWWLGVGFFVVVLWVGFFPFLVTATFSASGSLFSAAFFFTLFVLISVGGSLGWYSFFCGWSEGYPFLFSTATVCFVLFVSLRFFSRSLLLSQFLPRWSGPCVCSALGWVLGLFSSCFTTHHATWQREQDSPCPQPCCYLSYSRLFRAPWNDLSACRTDDMPWIMCLVLYKQMQSNPIISFWSQSCKAVDFSRLVCSDILFRRFCLLKHKGTSLYKFHFIKKIITLLGYAWLPFVRKQSCTYLESRGPLRSRKWRSAIRRAAHDLLNLGCLSWSRLQHQ